MTEEEIAELWKKMVKEEQDKEDRCACMGMEGLSSVSGGSSGASRGSMRKFVT